jgi:hypothetical protein
MKKTIRLTESDLVKIVKKVIKEQGASSDIRKIIAPASDDLVRAFGDDAARGIESALSRAISKQGNLMEKEGVLYLKSLRGGDGVKVESVKKALDAVASGKLTMDQVLNTLPRQLADGSEFRSAFQNLKLNPTPSTSIKLTPGTPEYNKHYGLPSNWKGTKEGYHEKMTGKNFYSGSN